MKTIRMKTIKILMISMVFLSTTISVAQKTWTNNRYTFNSDQGFISISHQENITYINLFPHFIDETRALNKKYSLDGLHLNGLGYLKWKAQIKAFVKK